MQFLKHLIKKYFWKWVFFKKIYGNAVNLNRQYVAQLDNTPQLSTKKLNIFTVDDEDGILLNLIVKTRTASRFFIDIGSNDCINSNCANLAFHHGWNGIFIDGNRTVLERGKYIYTRFFGEGVNRFSFIPKVVTPANINLLLAGHAGAKEVGLLSIDLDGNDYFIWDAIKVINPRIVVVEVQVEKGKTEFVPETTSIFELYESNIPKGASSLSMCKLARSKGYELVAANNGGYNLFFVRSDSLGNLNPISINEVL